MQITAYDSPFRLWIAEGFIDPKLTESIHDEIVGHRFAERDKWVRYVNSIEFRKHATTDIENVGSCTRTFFHLLNDDEQVRRFADLTGIEGLSADPYRHGSGVHFSEPGSWLQTHVDYAKHPRLPDMARRLSLLVFVCEEWREEWGGAFLACDPLGKVQRKIYPAPGRAVLFENSDRSYHGVEEMSADAPPRISIASYYISPATAADVRQRALFMPNRNGTKAPSEVALGVGSEV